jgi:hypothetical protein
MNQDKEIKKSNSAIIPTVVLGSILVTGSLGLGKLYKNVVNTQKLVDTNAVVTALKRDGYNQVGIRDSGMETQIDKCANESMATKIEEVPILVNSQTKFASMATCVPSGLNSLERK